MRNQINFYTLGLHLYIPMTNFGKKKTNQSHFAANIALELLGGVL